MQKFAIAIGETATGELVVVDGPTNDIDALKASVEKVVQSGGGKGDDAIESCVIMHSVRGIIKKRKGIPGIKKAADAAKKAKKEAEAAAKKEAEAAAKKEADAESKKAADDDKKESE